MNGQRDVDTIIASWLDDGPATLPMGTRRAISVGVRTQPRARRMAFPGGFTMRSFNLVAAATVIVLAVGGSVFVLSNRSSDPGGVPPSVVPSPAVTPRATSKRSRTSTKTSRTISAPCRPERSCRRAIPRWTIRESKTACAAWPSLRRW